MGYRDTLRRAYAPAILLAAMLAVGTRAGAQDFERTFGQQDDETGRAVLSMGDDGFIAAGYTIAPGGNQMAYVTRMNSNGGTLWERRFTVGGVPQTSGMDIKQLASGDYVLVGTISTLNCSGSGACAHIYAIRFTDNGDLVWYRSYGNGSTSQYATSEVETQVPNPGPDDAGNLVIAGYSVDYLNEHRGVLMRLTKEGALRWVTEYDTDPSAINDNQLMSVDEARVGTGAGDLVATGSAIFPAANHDAWVLRVDGTTGNITGATQGSARFSSAADDRGYSIQELQHGAGAGDLVVAGESFGRPGTTSSEVLMLETRPNPCDPAGQRADQFLGDNASQPNFARCVREITDSHFGAIGNVIVTGTSHTRAFGNSDDLFLQQFRALTMAPVGRHWVYGGALADSGYGVALTSGRGGAGVIATGATRSVPPAPPSHGADLYVVRAGASMETCTSTTVPVSSAAAKLQWSCVTTQITHPDWTILCSGDSIGPDWGAILCP